MKFKKLVSVTLAAVLALGVVGCGGGSDEAASSAASDANVTQIEAENPWEATVKGDGSLDRVKEAGVIKAGLDDSYPPMGYHDAETDEIIGFDVDMANAIGEKLGVEFEFVPADWNAIVASLQTGKFDTIISGMNMWDSRVEEVNYVPYGVADQYILVLNENVEDGMDDIEYTKTKSSVPSSVPPLRRISRQQALWKGKTSPSTRPSQRSPLTLTTAASTRSLLTASVL